MLYEISSENSLLSTWTTSSSIPIRIRNMNNIWNRFLRPCRRMTYLQGLQNASLARRNWSSVAILSDKDLYGLQPPKFKPFRTGLLPGTYTRYASSSDWLRTTVVTFPVLPKLLLLCQIC